jgi:hypothetical protein
MWQFGIAPEGRYRWSTGRGRTRNKCRRDLFGDLVDLRGVTEEQARACIHSANLRRVET